MDPPIKSEDDETPFLSYSGLTRVSIPEVSKATDYAEYEYVSADRMAGRYPQDEECKDDTMSRSSA